MYTRRSELPWKAYLVFFSVTKLFCIIMRACIMLYALFMGIIIIVIVINAYTVMAVRARLIFWYSSWFSRVTSVARTGTIFFFIIIIVHFSTVFFFIISNEPSLRLCIENARVSNTYNVRVLRDERIRNRKNLPNIFKNIVLFFFSRA